MGAPAVRDDIFAAAVSAIAAGLGRQPVLYSANGNLLQPSGTYSYSRTGAKRAGSMQNWIPKRLFSRESEAQEREAVVARSIDLTCNDPHAAGIVDGTATTVIGAGLMPHPCFDHGKIGLSDEDAKRLKGQMRAAFSVWSMFADAGQRMPFGRITFQAMRNLVQHGEYFVALPMLEDSARPYSLACQMIHPLRVKTPSDKVVNGNIHDGVELGQYGEPVAYWVRKSELNGAYNDHSQNFLRIPAKVGHRWNMIHRFVGRDPEDVRGWPWLTPALKFFRDFNDLLDAELVSNIVTAAFSMFIEAGAADPFTAATNMASSYETRNRSDGQTETIRYQEMVPGQIMYGDSGQKPHLLAASRPGTTFEPFTRLIKKSMASAIGIPYQVAFNDMDGITFAGFRSAMLQAWRVYSMHRSWMGQDLCQPIFTMVAEEAWLRGDLDVPEFYPLMHELTRCEWRGAPKGDIEPVKAVRADIEAINGRIKTRAEAIAERGTAEPGAIFDQLMEEEEMLKKRGLIPNTENADAKD
jgi:lambda family phage portal protein